MKFRKESTYLCTNKNKMKKNIMKLLSIASLVTMVGCSFGTSSETNSSKTSSKVSEVVGTSETSSSSSSSEIIVKKTPLATPVVTASDTVSGQVSWEDIDEAEYYLVFVNDDLEGVKTVATAYKVPLLDTCANTTVRVQAVVSEENENYVSSEVSSPVNVKYFASNNNEWDKEALKEEWSSEGTLNLINEGLDLSKGQSIAIVKVITNDNKHLAISMRDFEGQEDGETGAKVRVTINGTVLTPINYETEEVVLDKDCGREVIAIYDLSNYVGEDINVIRIKEVSNYSNHCVIMGVRMADYTSVVEAATQTNYWGRDYQSNWGGEMGPKDGVSKPATIASDPTWVKVGACDDINEGLKLQKEASVYKFVEVTKDNCMVTIAVRNFGAADEDYAGGVSVNGEFLKAVGDSEKYFTKKTSPTYFEGAGDGAEVATMKTYDLSDYIGMRVCLAISNLKCYAMGGNEDLVIGSVSFGKEKKITESTVDNLSDLTSFGSTDSIMIAGPATLFNEGINFRTNDFAGGVAQRFDLSEVETGKKVYVKYYWRSVVDDNVLGKFQAMVNGELTNTYSDYLLRDRSDNFAVIGYDLSSYVGEKVDVATHVPSRNYRVILSKVEYIVTDNVEENLSHPAAEDAPVQQTTNGEFYWGHDFTSNWGGEMGDSNLKYSTMLSSGWSGTGTVEEFNEGLRLGYDSSVSKTLTIDDQHVTMAFGARTFGGDFKGQVIVTPEDGSAVALKAYGYADDYFTKNGAATKVDNVDDDCRNAVLYTYDLSQFKDKTVEVTIKNVAVQDQGYDDRLIIGSVGFTSVLRVTESLNWAANTIKETGYTSNLQVLPVGVFAIYNEGINFRTQDFAGGITRTFDLSDSQLENKTVKVQVGFRNFNSSGEDIEFQMLLNGSLVATETKNINESVTYLEFDLTQLVGQSNVNLAVRIGTRTYRICLTDLNVVVADK